MALALHALARTKIDQFDLFVLQQDVLTMKYGVNNTAIKWEKATV